jgi:acetyl-CoA carboxylase/biotin carboxylase 1
MDPWRVPERCSGEEKRGDCVPCEEYCKALGGTDAIRSILIANNGMAAVKFMRSVRLWAYESFGTERAVLLVAMATPEDMRINAEHILLYSPSPSLF